MKKFSSLNEAKALVEMTYPNGMISAKDGKVLMDRIVKLEAALRFYADNRNWIDTNGDDSWDSEIQCDNGQKARSALESSPDGKEGG